MRFLNSVFTIVLSTITILGYAQDGAANAVQSLSNRKLYIALETVNKDVFAKLDEKSQEEYTKAVANYNQLIVDVAKEYWDINAIVKFKNFDELKAVENASPKDWLLLYPSTVSKLEDTSTRGLTYYKSILQDNRQRVYNDFVITYKLVNFEDWNKKKRIIACTVAGLWPQQSDLQFMYQNILGFLKEVKRLDAFVDAKLIAADNNAKLADKTLALNIDLFEKTLPTEKEIKAVYPHKFVLTTTDSISKWLIEKKDIAYVQIVPKVGVGKSTYEHYIMDGPTGVILGYASDKSTGHKSIDLEMLKRYIITAPQKKDKE